MSDDEATNATRVIIDMMEGFSAMLLGQKESLNDVEKMALFMSIPKMLTSMKTSTVDRVSGILLPVACLVGVGSYSVRLSRLYGEKIETERYRQQYEAQGETVYEPTDQQENQFNVDDTPIGGLNGKWKTELAMNRRMP